MKSSVEIRRFADNDYSVYFKDIDCSTRGTLEQCLEAVEQYMDGMSKW